MSFFGLLAIARPYCPHCETDVHGDYWPTELWEDVGFEIPETQYKCSKCGTEMHIESHGGGLFNVYPDENTFPSEIFFPDEDDFDEDDSAE